LATHCTVDVVCFGAGLGSSQTVRDRPLDCSLLTEEQLHLVRMGVENQLVIYYLGVEAGVVVAMVVIDWSTHSIRLGQESGAEGS
jgi:hypothetical protein